MLLEAHINHQKKQLVKRPEDEESGNDPETAIEENSRINIFQRLPKPKVVCWVTAKNLYSRALLMLCIGSTYRSKLLDRTNIVEECMDMLVKAEVEENALKSDFYSATWCEY